MSTNPMPLPPENQSEQKKGIFMLLDKLVLLFKKIVHKEDQGAIFEKKVEEFKKKIDELDEQNEETNEYLRDVAESLENLTGVMEKGNLKDIQQCANEFRAKADEGLEELKRKGEKGFTLSSDRIEEVLTQAFGPDIMDKLYKKDENGERVLSPDVKFFVDKENNKGDLYLVVGSEAVKVNKVKRKQLEDGSTKETIILEKSKLYHRDGKCYLDFDVKTMKGTALEQIGIPTDYTIEKAIARAAVSSRKEYMEAKKAKAEMMKAEMDAVAGTIDKPFEKDNFHCIRNEEEGTYSIKDRHTNTMITFKYDKETDSLIGYFSRVKGFEPIGNPIEAMRLSKVDGSIRYEFGTNPLAEKILECEMAQKWLEMSGVPMDQYKAMRHIGNELPGEKVNAKNNPKVHELKNTLENYFKHTKGLEGYRAYIDDSRGGKTQVKIITPDNSKYYISFNKNGDIVNQSWSAATLVDGTVNREITPVVRTVAKSDLVVDKDTFASREFGVCYDSVREAISQISQKTQGKYTYGTTMSAGGEKAVRDAKVSEFIKAAAAYAANGIRVNNLEGKMDDQRLVNTILNEVEAQTGTYPSEKYRDQLMEYAYDISYELSQSGVIDNSHTQQIVGNDKVRTPETFESRGVIDNSDGGAPAASAAAKAQTEAEAPAAAEAAAQPQTVEAPEATEVAPEAPEAPAAPEATETPAKSQQAEAPEKSNDGMENFVRNNDPAYQERKSNETKGRDASDPKKETRRKTNAVSR